MGDRTTSPCPEWRPAPASGKGDAGIAEKSPLPEKEGGIGVDARSVYGRLNSQGLSSFVAAIISRLSFLSGTSPAIFQMSH